MSDHDDAGKFAKGNKANPGGNPSTKAKRVRLRLKRSLLDVLMRNDGAALTSIAESLTVKAKEGDLAAVRLLRDLLNASEADLADDLAQLKRDMKALKGASK